MIRLHPSRIGQKGNKLWRAAGALSMAVFFTLSPLGAVFAAQATAVKAVASPVLSASGVTYNPVQSVAMKPGAKMSFEIKMKNTGNVNWTNDGANFVALATVNPEKRHSVFEDASWKEVYYRPARLSEHVVKPGEMGTFKFTIKAPTKTGSYVERFKAVSKGVDWIAGSEVLLAITVTKNAPDPLPIQVKETTLKVDYPVRDAAYTAKWVTPQVLEIKAKPGEQIQQTLEVKNAGTAKWKESGVKMVTLTSVRPNDHGSYFYVAGQGWKTNNEIVVPGPTTAGKSIKIPLTLQAPADPGVYTDHFRLAADDYSWVKNGEVKIVLSVAYDDEQTTATDNPESGPTITDLYFKDLTYQALYLVSSMRSVDITPGQTVSLQVGFKNTGEKPWVKTGNKFTSLYTIAPNYRSSRFSGNGTLNAGWVSDNQIAMVQDVVKPGEIGFFKFDLTAPNTPGQYVEKFNLAVENVTWLQGGSLELPVNVLGNPNETGQPGTPTSALGPIMRVGIISSDEPFVVTADTPFEVRSGNGDLLASLPARSPVSVTYTDATLSYHVVAAGLDRTQTDYVTMQSLDLTTIMQITSLNRPLPWNPVINENTFRGSIEIRHSRATGRTWAINILPMEYYLKGIAETSSSSPVEFLKVMTVAARTYGYYHYQRQTKHADEHFYVDSQFDQVYKGYALEQRHPGLVQAVNETTGMVVTYTDAQTPTKIAITPYYSNSDGRTRSWHEVWGGTVPWVQSVPVPQDAGKKLNGHGVGMSARGGLIMVSDEGKTYDQVLKYFFQGIDIQKWY